jgi:LacI family kdg operon repressor
MPKKPTIATVAREAGVAVSTVSRFLNGRYVSQEVRARLAEVIATLGYERSWTARNLSLGRRGSIGVVVDSSEDPWFVHVLAGIEEDASTDSSSSSRSVVNDRSCAPPSMQGCRRLRWRPTRR